jgi:hypothetical protein
MQVALDVPSFLLGRGDDARPRSSDFVELMAKFQPQPGDLDRQAGTCKHRVKHCIGGGSCAAHIPYLHATSLNRHELPVSRLLRLNLSVRIHYAVAVLPVKSKGQTLVSQHLPQDSFQCLRRYESGAEVTLECGDPP